MHHFPYFFLSLIALAGLFSSLGFLVMLAVAVWRFRSRREQVAAETDLPPVTVMKPLCGTEPHLEENLESFFCQQYPCFELIFGFRTPDDPALQVVSRLRERHPEVSVKLAFAGEPEYPNAKVCSLRKIYACASYDHFVISDSDVLVAPDYLREVVAPLLDPKIGVVTCLYRGLESGGPWSRLEALGMSVEMTAGVVVSAMMGEMNFALGPSMSTRRDVLEAIGGFERMANYCADDYVLGNWANRAGYKVHLSKHVIGHVAMNRGFWESMQHQIRWMRSTRFSLPTGHASTVLSYAMPFGLLACALLLIVHHPVAAVAALVLAFVNRLLMSLLSGWGVVRDHVSLTHCWLFPVRDLMGFFFWCGSYAGNTVIWRQQRYRLLEEGRMECCDAEEAVQEEPVELLPL